MTAPTVTHWAADANGARSASFAPRPGVQVRVFSHDVEDNEYVHVLARDLADQAAARARDDAEALRLNKQIDLLSREIASLRRQLPPSAPVRLLGTGYVRFRDGQPWLMSKRLRGWAEFGVRCESWDDLFRRYDVRVVGHGEDEHGPWWAVENGARS